MLDEFAGHDDVELFVEVKVFSILAGDIVATFFECLDVLALDIDASDVTRMLTEEIVDPDAFFMLNFERMLDTTDIKNVFAFDEGIQRSEHFVF